MVLLWLRLPVFADESLFPYAGATFGAALTAVNKLSDSSGSLVTDFRTGYFTGITAGFALHSPLEWNIDRIRIEAELGHRSNVLSRIKNPQGQSVAISGTFTITNLMVNGYLDNTGMVINDVPVTLFLTAGAGVATASISAINFQGIPLVASARDSRLAYQVGGGIGYELTRNITLDVSYKYMGTSPFKFAGVKADYGSHNVMLGAWYGFK